MQGKIGLDIRNQQEKSTRIMSFSSWDLKKFKKCRPVIKTVSSAHMITSVSVELPSYVTLRITSWFVQVRQG